MGNTQGRSPEEIKGKKKGKLPKGHHGKQFSPPQGRSGVSHQNGGIVNNTNHRESSIHLPLKEFEVPDFLKDTQSQPRQGNSSPVVKRNLKDSDFSTMNGSGLMIPRKELTIPDFLRSKDESNRNSVVENQGRGQKLKASLDRTPRNSERDYRKMNGEHKAHEHSTDQKQHQEGKRMPKLQENSQVVEGTIIRGHNGTSADSLERLGPSAKSQLKTVNRQKSHNWMETDSLQSSSSQSLTEPISTMSSDKDKFSVSVRDHSELVRKGIISNGTLSSVGKYHLHGAADSYVEDDVDSPLSTERSSNFNSSIGYNESSPEQSNRKVKRKDSLQARLRSRITKQERANKAVPRVRYDSDSTTVSDHSAFGDVTPMYSSRRKSTPGLNSLNDLPEDLLIFIFSHLPSRDLCRASGVCSKWQKLCWDPLLWSTISISNYQDSDINKVLRTILTKLAMDTQGYCLNVLTIKLNGCELLADKGLGFIARFCIDLEGLDVSGCCCITSKGLHEVLTNCRAVTQLNVTGCTCVNSLSAPVAVANGLGLGQNGTSLKLRHLDLSDCVAFDDLGLRVVSLSCGLLESLYLRRCNRVTDVGIKHVAQHCSRLKELSISDCFKVRDFSLKEIAKHCASLKYLSAAKCPVTDTGIKLIGKHCIKLKYVNIRGCEAVTDVGITHIVQNCLKLRSLDAGKCDITDNGLHIIGIHCPQLKKLSVRGCDRVTDVGIRTIAAQCCSLQYLNVQECSLNYKTFMYIREHCKNCVIEHTCPAFF